MKKVFMVVMALLISVAFAVTIFAQEKPATEKSPAEAPKAVSDAPKTEKPKAKSKRLTGEVTNIEADSVTVKGKKSEKVFDISKAKFKGYKDATEIKTGDKVLVNYKEIDGKAVATRVAKPAPKKAPAAPKPAEEPAAEPAK